MTQEIIYDLADNSWNNYNKKHWLEVDGLLVRKENLEQVYVQLDFITDLLVKSKVRMANGFSWKTKKKSCILVCCDKPTKTIAK